MPHVHGKASLSRFEMPDPAIRKVLVPPTRYVFTVVLKMLQIKVLDWVGGTPFLPTDSSNPDFLAAIRSLRHEFPVDQ